MRVRMRVGMSVTVVVVVAVRVPVVAIRRPVCFEHIGKDGVGDQLVDELGVAAVSTSRTDRPVQSSSPSDPLIDRLQLVPEAYRFIHRLVVLG